jgi:ribosomal protein S18 acetylase RimI-like enzyme
MLEAMRTRERGQTPFLDVTARYGNTLAIQLYERLGFTTRIVAHYAKVRSRRES